MQEEILFQNQSPNEFVTEIVNAEELYDICGEYVIEEYISQSHSQIQSQGSSGTTQNYSNQQKSMSNEKMELKTPSNYTFMNCNVTINNVYKN